MAFLRGPSNYVGRRGRQDIGLPTTLENAIAHLTANFTVIPTVTKLLIMLDFYISRSECAHCYLMRARISRRIMLASLT